MLTTAASFFLSRLQDIVKWSDIFRRLTHKSLLGFFFPFSLDKSEMEQSHLAKQPPVFPTNHLF